MTRDTTVPIRIISTNSLERKEGVYCSQLLCLQGLLNVTEIYDFDQIY